MDPQQRLVLEQGYAALHAARYDRTTLLGSDTGVALGIYSTEFDTVLHAGPHKSSVYAVTASSLSIASGRLSYVLGLHGPCVSYDTACSAALIATHASLCAHGLPWALEAQCEHFPTVTVALHQLRCIRRQTPATTLQLTPRPTAAGHSSR